MVPRRLSLALALAATPLATADAQSLRGSRESIDRMYHQAVGEGLSFFATTSTVRRQIEAGRLVRLSQNGDFRLHRVSLPYVRPATRTFVQRLAAQYHAECGERLVVTSAVRPTTRQPANAADRSVHPTGMAIDLRKPAKRPCLTWLRNTLLDLEGAGVLEATEEFSPPHFHVAVFTGPYARYAAGRAIEVPVGSTRVVARESTPAADDPRTHVVRRGETLWGIAKRHDTTVDAITRANALGRRPIRPGQSLRIPADTERGN